MYTVHCTVFINISSSDFSKVPVSHIYSADTCILVLLKEVNVLRNRPLKD